MAYVTLDDLKNRLGSTLYARLTDRANGTTANDAVGQRVVDEALAEVDSHLARRYRTPVDLAAHPELANALAVRVLDVAEFAAWKSSPFVTDPPQRVQAIYRAALQWLSDVAQGRLVLPAVSPPESAVAHDMSPLSSGSPRQFTADELDGL